MTMIAQATTLAFNDEIERGALTPSSAQDEIPTLLDMGAATAACHGLDLKAVLLDLKAVLHEASHGH